MATYLEAPLVLRKTARGEQEFAASGRSLPLKMRNALILVNGERSVAQLAAMLPKLPVAEMLATLAASGHVIAETPLASPPAAPAALAVPKTVPEAPRQALPARSAADSIVVAGGAPVAAARQAAADSTSPWVETVRAIAVAEVEKLTFSGGTLLVERLRRMRRPAELRMEIARTAHYLERFVDPVAARRFSDEMTLHLQRS